MKVHAKKSANLPGAWVVNSKDKGRKSIKNENIYLDNNEEFQIELFNPLKNCVLADIRLNGQSISKTGLIVKPGQRFYLDCFVDDKKKFTFQTYDVENTLSNQESIENNGVMEVFFYKEQAVNINNWRDRFKKVVIREYYPIYPWWEKHYYDPYRQNIWYSNSGSGTFTFDSNLGTLSNSLSNNTVSVNNLTNCSYTSDLNINSMDLNNSIETGRVEKGDLSQQQFMEVDMDFEKNYIHHIVYQLLPNSRKPVEVDTKKVTEKLEQGHQAANLLIKLADLKEAGILTEEEFKEKKKEILARI